MSMGWSVIAVFVVFCIANVVWMAHCAVHTQAMLAAQGEQDWFIDSLVWVNRQLTGKPPRQGKAVVDQPPRT
jgi:hypothetical protein